MNGRVYDYNLGRFLSVDPIIQSPGNSQSLNPYSYIMNNPLAGTDPTGYRGCAASRIDHVCGGTDADHGGFGLLTSFLGDKGNSGVAKDNGAQQKLPPVQVKQPTQATEVEGPKETAATKGDSSGTSGGFGEPVHYDATANGGEFDALSGQINTGNNTLDKEKLIIGGIEVAAGGTGIVATVIAGGACIILEPCGAIAIGAIVAGGAVSVITTNDGLTKLRSAEDGINRPNTIPAIGKMVAGSQGEQTGAKIDKALSILGGTKSLATIVKGIEKNAPEILESIDAAKTVYSEILKEN